MKSNDEFMCRFIEERDEKNLIDYNMNPSSSCVLISLKQILNQVAHRWVTHHNQTHQPSQ
jgi:hypothetical protein